ncbi:serine O-acetyltransferase EpsC [Rhizobium mongolense]|uniref:serine O-acetyltransferase EpsC n=1 Tax=Rhizobium mongolense TaxID=57676 RepID=UPI003557878D
MMSSPAPTNANSYSNSEQEIWGALLKEACRLKTCEPKLAGFIDRSILDFGCFQHALRAQLVARFSGDTLPPLQLSEIVDEAHRLDSRLVQAGAADLMAYRSRNAAFGNYLSPFLYFKGFHALQAQRISNHLWEHAQRDLAVHLYDRICQVSGTDIHPAVKFGKGIFIDHAIGLVVGETAVVEDNVSLLHNVTLGATGNDRGDRHPKIRRGAIVGAGAIILGNIDIGYGARVGAGSVVIKSVTPYTTVVGTPAKPVRRDLASRAERSSGADHDQFDWVI